MGCCGRGGSELSSCPRASQAGARESQTWEELASLGEWGCGKAWVPQRSGLAEREGMPREEHY